MRARADVVLAVRSDSFAGVERYLCDVAGGLHGRGWRVAVVGGEPDRMRERLPAGVPHSAASTTAGTAQALARQGRARLVHAHMSAAETAAVLTRPVTGGRVLATRHFAGGRGSSRLARPALRAMSLGIAHEIAISGFVARSVQRETTVLLNGVPRRDPVIPTGDRTILVMQRLEPEKDTATAIAAWALSGLGPAGWTLVVAGRGAERNRLALLATEAGVANSVEFVGFLDRPEQVVPRAHAFLATAPAEPFGLAVVEAMSWGVPVIAADGGAHPETVGEAGLLFRAGDVGACARALRRLATDPALARELGERGRLRQQEFLSLDRHLDGLEAVYQEVAT